MFVCYICVHSNPLFLCKYIFLETIKWDVGLTIGHDVAEKRDEKKVGLSSY